MRGEPTGFWAKLRYDRDTRTVVEWHPLADHCADVAAVTEALLSLPIWRSRLASLVGQSLSDVTCARLCVLAALHDIGKLNIGFQAKGRPELGTTTGHVKPALGALLRRPGPFSCLDDLAAWGDGATALLVSALCHHGCPYNADYTEGPDWWQAAWWTRRDNLSPHDGATDLLARSRAWFPLAFQKDHASLPDSAMLSHAFAGLVMLADWVGSDTRFFEFSQSEETDRMVFARSRAHEAVLALAFDVPLRTRTDASRRDPFLRIAAAGYVPRSAQTALISLPRDEKGSITILESETGSGKTEAVLARFVSLFEAGLVDGLYFALPTRSAATQMHGRVREAAERAFTNPPAVILAVPGYLRVDDVEGRRLPPFEVLWPDQERFRYRAWAAENPKRFLAGCIVVGTIDQVLLSSLMVGHAHLRATALLRHLLVIDEVHASDAYMTEILETVLARHVAAGGHSILLSATLGAEARARLLRPGESTTLPTFAEAERAPYPLMTHRGDSERVVQIDSDGAERAIQVGIHPWLENPEALAVAAFSAAIQGAKVLVIRNTVADCVRTQQAVEEVAGRLKQTTVLFTCAGISAPHHALFARVDRHLLDHALEQQIGKNRLPGGCLVVATQTVQQSLDLDTDVLFSDLCPVDVLLQRIGRLHRHGRTRPEGFERPQAFVLVPPRRDLGLLLSESGVSRNYHGLGRVYPDLRILEATWRLVERHPRWLIPSMCRHLVESGIHSGMLNAIVQDRGPRWQAHANHVVGTARGHQRQAQLNMVDWSASYAGISFPSAVDQRITTRLGEGDRRVRFPVPASGPFGHPIDEVVLRAWWVREVSPEAEYAEHVSTVGGVTRFRFGETFFVYDRLGLRPEQSSGSIAEMASEE